MRGRKPIPPEQKLAAYGLAIDELDLPKVAGEPEMPPGFDAAHAAEWDAVVADLREAQTLSREIGATVEVYVRNLLRMRMAEGMVAEQGAIAHPEKPAEFEAFVKAETAKWGPVVKQSGARVD